MKIGLITIQKSTLNYGASLQCYALYTRLKTDFGHCEVIDLLQPFHTGYIPSINFPGEMTVRQIIGIYKYRLAAFLKSGKAGRIRNKRFKQFNDKVQYTRRYYSINSLYNRPPKFDIFVTGSDQVWSPLLPFVNEPYFLTFTQGDNKRISYASSFGIEQLPDSLQYDYRKWLSRYDMLSVRERSGADIIKKLIGKDVPVVMDPVFLLDQEQWRKEECPVDNVKPKSYVFLYMLIFDPGIIKKAESYAMKKKLRLFFCLSEKRTVKPDYGIQIPDAGPAEWLWLIDNAHTVMTTSFHGSAFSVIFGCPVIILSKNGVSTNTRIENLASQFNISRNIVEIDSDEDFSNNDFRIDINEFLLRNEVTRSIEYLKSAIYATKH